MPFDNPIADYECRCCVWILGAQGKHRRISVHLFIVTAVAVVRSKGLAVVVDLGPFEVGAGIDERFVPCCTSFDSYSRHGSVFDCSSR